MIYLIVPPIVIILAIAILIVFLTRVLTNDQEETIDKRPNKKVEKVEKTFFSRKEKKNEKKEKKGKKKVEINERFKRGGKLFKEKSGVAAKKIKNTLENSGGAVSANSNTQGINVGKNAGKQVVSLRKKSMVSHKIEDSDSRDEKELSFMKEIEKDPQNSKKYEKLADYYMEQEKFEDARECYKYVLRLNPRHKRAQIAMKNLDRIL
ncbi:MAG: tetratricopeptide repeat protein [Patescibacteria group bacterium]